MVVHWQLTVPGACRAPDCSGSSCGVLPEARAFDSTWGDSSVDSTVKRAAYTEEFASIHFNPYNLLYGEQGDILSAIDRYAPPGCISDTFTGVVSLKCLHLETSSPLSLRL